MPSSRLYPSERGLRDQKHRRIGEWRHTADVYLAQHIGVFTELALRSKKKIAIP